MKSIAEIVAALDGAGEAIRAADARVGAAYRALANDPSSAGRSAAAEAVRAKRDLIHTLRRRIGATPAAGETEHARALTVRALKLWEDGLTASARALRVERADQRDAEAREAERLLERAGEAVLESRAALRLRRL